MRNRLFTLCLLFYPRAQRARDGGMLRDLALELSECGGATREAVGLVRGGVGARWQRYAQAVPNAPWGEALRKLALPLAVFNAAPLLMRFMSMNSFRYLEYWFLLSAFGSLLVLVGATVRWRVLATVGVALFAISIIRDDIFAATNNYVNLLTLPRYAAQLLELVVLVITALALPRCSVERVCSSLCSFRSIPIVAMLCIPGVAILGFTPDYTVVDSGGLMALELVGFLVLPIFAVFGGLFSMRRKPSQALAAAVFLVFLLAKSTLYFPPSLLLSYGHQEIWVWSWIVAMVFFFVVFLAVVARKTTEYQVSQPYVSHK